jgi:hypothetical protein
LYVASERTRCELVVDVQDADEVACGAGERECSSDAGTAVAARAGRDLPVLGYKA